jgi:uncharacterized protein DUF1365
VKASIYEVTISHARSAPLRNVFRYRSYLWLVDLDHLPRARGVDLGGGRVTMLVHARRYRMSLPEPDANPDGRLSLSVRLDRPDGQSFAASVAAGPSRPPGGSCSMPPSVTRGPPPPSAHGSAGRACGSTGAGCR